jgi:hypothetical protein
LLERSFILVGTASIRREEVAKDMAISTKTAVAIGSGLLVLGAGIGITGVASADTPGGPGPTTAPTVAPAPSDPQPPGEVPQREVPGWPMSPEQEQMLVQTLSGMLGFDEAEVQAALDQVHADWAVQGPAALNPWLDRAVEAGILTQDEAEALRTAVEQGGIDLGPR